MLRTRKMLISLSLFTMIITAFSVQGAGTEAIKQQASLTIGLIPEQNIFKQLERYEPLADYISKKIGIKIELTLLRRYGNIIDNFASAGMDGAFFGSFSYALAHARLGLEPVARPEDHNGRSTYYGLIFVRKDSGIKNINDMQNKSFVFVDKATTAGYLLPRAYFKKHEIENYSTFLKEAYFAGTHQDAIYDVLNRKADIGAAKNTMFYRLAAEDKRISDELVILERSPDVPENGLAVKKSLDASIKQQLKATLISMNTDPEGMEVLKKFGARRFIETSNDDYAAVYRYVQEIGLNLSTYDYINE